MQRVRRVLGILGKKKKNTEEPEASSPKSNSFIDEKPLSQSSIFIPAKPTQTPILTPTDTLSTSENFAPLSKEFRGESICDEKEQSSQEDLRIEKEEKILDENEKIIKDFQEKIANVINQLENIPEVDICKNELTTNIHLKKSNPAKYVEKCLPAIKKYQSTKAPDSFMSFEKLIEIYQEKYNQSLNVSEDIQKEHNILSDPIQRLTNIKKLIVNTEVCIKNYYTEEKLEELRNQIISSEQVSSLRLG